MSRSQVFIFVLLFLHSLAAVCIESQGRSDLFFVPSRLRLSSFFYGPPISNLSKNSTPSVWKDSPSGLNIENQLIFHYQLADQISITPVFDFQYQITDPYHVNQSNRLYLAYDSFAYLSFWNAIDWSIANTQFDIDFDLWYYVPSSEYSRENYSLGSVRTSANPHIRFGRSGLDLYWLNYIRYFLQTGDYEYLNKQATLPRVFLYTGPQMSYEVFRKATMWALYETSILFDTLGVPSTRDPNRLREDVQAGVEFQLSNAIHLTPYVGWFIGQPLKTSSLNFITSIRLL